MVSAAPGESRKVLFLQLDDPDCSQKLTYDYRGRHMLRFHLPGGSALSSERHGMTPYDSMKFISATDTTRAVVNAEGPGSFGLGSLLGGVVSVGTNVAGLGLFRWAG